MTNIPKAPLHDNPYHHKVKGFHDAFAYIFVQTALVFANLFFRERYGHRAVVLETVAAIPGMVGALFQHLKALRRIRDDHGWIQTLLDEAENERMHLMVYAHIAKPTWFERFLIVAAQVFFYLFYFTVYLFSTRTAHRLVGYLEEEAVHSYTKYLEYIETHPEENIPAPDIAKHYWDLPSDARLKEVIIATHKDEMLHRDVNHTFADDIKQGANK